MGPGLGAQNAGYGTCCLPTGVVLQKSMARRPVVLGTADAEQRLLQNNKSCPEKEGHTRHMVRCDLCCVLPEGC